MAKKAKKEQPRSEETKQKLIEVAIKTFAAVGYDGTSTRELANRAQANVSAIRYHFGDKQGLYLAALRHIAESYREQISPFLERVRSKMNDPGVKRKELIDFLCDIVGSLAARLVGPEMDDAWPRLVAREEMNPTAGHALLFNTQRLVIETIAGLIGKILNQPPDSERVRIRTMAVIGQVLVFRNSRTAVMRAVGWKEIGKPEISTLQSVLEEHCRTLMAK
jgi:TetR/AcrR family transcriptional regulator, regulator of cefoperazone and chloramphenicol sensitivity